MIADSFDCPTTTGKRNGKLVQLEKASAVLETVMLANVAPLESKAATVWLPGCGSTPRVIIRVFLKEGVCPCDACLSRSRYKAPWYPAITPAHSRCGERCNSH